MIQISDKHLCCGCAACVQACPKQCISFEEDEQGFRYPAAAPRIIARMRPSLASRAYHLARRILSKIYHIIIKS